MDSTELVQKLTNLLSLESENEVVEFKEANDGFDFRKLGKYFSALSNEANLKKVDFAWLVFGIKDKTKEVIGTNYRLQNLQSLKHELAGQTTDSMTFYEIFDFLYLGKRVVLFQISPAPQGIPIAFNGHYYARNHESLVALNISKLEQIRNQIRKVDWSAQICAGATINDLDAEAILKARENFKIKNPRVATEVDSWDDITFLNKAKITKNGVITNAAIILLGKSESEHFISPSVAKISWILKDKNNLERDYEHFSCPFLLATNQVFNKIRNLKYRYIKDETIFPEEVDQYDPFIIREALNNCIAHQDYQLNGRINVIEKEDGHLIFTNLGSFYPGSIENVINLDAPPEQYRNTMLTQAMVNLNMIDTIGSGIKRMFTIQREKLFPMPEYKIENNRVTVEIIGKVIDLEYARTLTKNPDLTLMQIIMLDKVQKNQVLNDLEIQILKSKNLIEGRKPNFHISKSLAQSTGQQANYIKHKGIDKKYYKEIILDYLRKFKTASRSELESLLFDKLPDVMDQKQKRSKTKNILYEMHKTDKTIVYKGSGTNSKWILNEN